MKHKKLILSLLLGIPFLAISQTTPSLSTGTFTAKLSSDNSVTFSVTRQDDDVAIITRIVSSSSSDDKKCYYALDGATLDGRNIKVLDSDIPYWYISVKDNIPPMMYAAKDPVTVDCNCAVFAATSCTVNEDKFPCLSCDDVECGNCILTSSGGIVLKAPSIILEGVEYTPANSPVYSSTTSPSLLRSKIGPKTASQLQYTKINDIAYVQVRDNLPIRETDLSSFYALDGLSFKDNHLDIPNNDLHYWFVSFDSKDEDPVEAIPYSAGGITVDCKCEQGTGSCGSPTLQGSCLMCPCGTCSGNCKVDKTKTGTKPGIILQATSVYYKGVLYEIQ